MKRFSHNLSIILLSFVLSSSVTLFATDLDSLGTTPQNQDVTVQVHQETPTDVEVPSTEGTTSSPSGSGAMSDRQPTVIGDFVRGFEPVTQESMAQAQVIVSPLLSFISLAISVILDVAFAGVFLTSALDLLYIGFPLIGKFMDGGASENMQGGGMPMQGGGMPMQGGYGGGYGGGGFGGGYGSGYGGRGGFGGMQGGGMPMQGGQQQGKPFRLKLVSNDAINAVMMCSTPQSQGTFKNTASEYFKSRVFFVIIFFVTAPILLSSVISGFGVNCGEWILTQVLKVM